MPEEKSLVFRGEPLRLDRFLARELSSLSRSYLQRLIKDGRVAVNGRREPARCPMAEGDRVTVSLPDFTGLPASAAKDVPILHEDKDIIVVDKPADLVVHPAGPHQEGTLIQRLWPKLAPAWGAVPRGPSPAAARPGVVHRLDRGTSGVMVIAKTPKAAESLSRQFAEREVKKVYWALVEGLPSPEKGHIRSMVGRSRRRPHRMSVQDQGRWSETEFTVLARFPKAGPKGRALLEARPLTGRTHQIRVQLAALGHPLVGDGTYGDAPPGRRPFLHALSLSLAHPRTGKPSSWSAPPPADFTAALRKSGWTGRPSGKQSP